MRPDFDYCTRQSRLRLKPGKLDFDYRTERSRLKRWGRGAVRGQSRVYRMTARVPLAWAPTHLDDDLTGSFGDDVAGL